MIIGITIIQVLVAIALVLIVLLQTGRGSEIGAAFGSGASQTLFGSSGTSGFMTRLTTIVVVVFMLSSLSLAYIYSRAGEGAYVRTRRSVPMRQSNAPVQQAPVQPGPTGAK
jgi:preprotein translocase subunit SecG